MKAVSETHAALAENHQCHEHFEHTAVEKVSDDTVHWRGACTVCGQPLVEVYDYAGTFNPDTGECLHRLLSETVRSIHDAVSKLVSAVEAGEWRRAVQFQTEINAKLRALITDGEA